jgi:transmembrane sensor
MDSSQDRPTEEAARWYARLQAHDCSPEDTAAFERWRSGDARNAAAYAAAARLGDALAHSAMTHPRLKAMIDEAASAGATLPADFDDEPAPLVAELVRRPVAARVPAVRRAATRRAALAAAVAAFGVAVGITVGLDREPRDGADYPTLRFAAGLARRTVSLDDGTDMQLDVGAVAEVRFVASAREVMLVRGRALFDVAHDATRPFIVAAGAARVTAVGTVFQVERSAERLVVTLAEGAIDVSPTDGAADAASMRLAPGEEIRVNDVEWVRHTVDPRAATSWSTGRHVFRQTRLDDAVEDINRYASVKVRLADPTLAELAVSGNFAAGDSESIVTAFAAVLPLRVAQSGAELTLHRRGARQGR